MGVNSYPFIVSSLKLDLTFFSSCSAEATGRSTLRGTTDHVMNTIFLVQGMNNPTHQPGGWFAFAPFTVQDKH